MPHDQKKGCGCTGSCPACELDPFTRNAYWTGKLLVARDFVDEQRYVVDKFRHHNQRLHGSGVVCGLKVVAHAKESCRDRFVCVQPGTAVDCCGHDVIVRELDCLDLWEIPKIKELREKAAAGVDTGVHALQICIRYRECETEPVPVLYDECGCADDKCAPNRILESYELHAMVIDPTDLKPEPHFPDLCGDLWTKSLDKCPDCDQPNCIVLATIEGWTVGSKIVDGPPPPLAAGQVGIDNLKGRTFLPSTQLMTEVINCILGKPPGPAVPPVPPVPPVPVGITEVRLEVEDCSAEPRIETASGVVTLHLPKCCGGELTHVCSINWTHAETISAAQLRQEGIIIAFDGFLNTKDVDPQHLRHSFIVEALHKRDDDGLECWCQLAGKYESFRLKTPCDLLSGRLPKDAKVNALRFRPDRDREFPEPLIRVRLLGDLIRDLKNGRAIDANHLPPWVPERKSGDCIEGGTFESWFEIGDR